MERERKRERERENIFRSSENQASQNKTFLQKS